MGWSFLAIPALPRICMSAVGGYFGAKSVLDYSIHTNLWIGSYSPVLLSQGFTPTGVRALRQVSDFAKVAPVGPRKCLGGAQEAPGGWWVGSGAGHHVAPDAERASSMCSCYAKATSLTCQPCSRNHGILFPCGGPSAKRSCFGRHTLGYKSKRAMLFKHHSV